MAQSPPFSITETTPADSDFVRLFPAAERLFRDIVESWLVMEHDATTGRHSIPVDSTAGLAALSYPADGAMVYDETLTRFRVRVGGSFVTIGPEFASGTKLLCAQASAPVGWTKDATAAFNDAAVRVVTGGSGGSTGGTAAFSTTFASRTPSGTNAGTAISIAQLPAHFHHLFSDSGATAGNFASNARSGGTDIDYTILARANPPTISRSESVGNGDTHTHTFTGDAMDFAVKFLDVIVIVKD